MSWMCRWSRSIDLPGAMCRLPLTRATSTKPNILYLRVLPEAPSLSQTVYLPLNSKTHAAFLVSTKTSTRRLWRHSMCMNGMEFCDSLGMYTASSMPNWCSVRETSFSHVTFGESGSFSSQFNRSNLPRSLKKQNVSLGTITCIQLVSLDIVHDDHFHLRSTTAVNWPKESVAHRRLSLSLLLTRSE